LRSISQFLALAWGTHRGYAAATVLLRLARAGVPVATLWVAKLIIDTVVAARMGNLDASRLWALVALEMAIVLAGEALSKVSAAVEGLFGDLCSNQISERLIRHAATLDLARFEDPAFYDQLERAQRQTTGRIGLLVQLMALCQDLLTLLSLAAAVLAYSPWLLALLVAAVLPGFFGETHFTSLEYSLLYRWTPERRQLDYLRYLGASDKTAKEVHMFGLAGWLVRRYQTLAQRFYQENRRLAVRRGIAATLLSMLGMAGYYGAYVIILARGLYGVISIGTLTFLAASFARSRDVCQRLLLTAGNIYEQSLYTRDLFDFFRMEPTILSPPGAVALPARMRDGVRFENVGFRYSGGDAWALRNINLRIAPGERLALVGENGAGKTTLTKLLARLYDPTEGRILLDGVDLREYDLESLRRAIGVIFQDFVRYDMRFDENIAVGRIEDIENQLEGAAPPAALVDAAEKSLAASLLPRFPNGYRQMLGRRFEGGVDLSGGEWQKIALARAYIRAAQVVILDEPTAALDARAEYEVFTRFAELLAGQTAILVSHRFSTVRMAERIVVLQRGEIVEEGTHADLVTRNGLYAELFSMQAEGYR
jgi:ATP-binding cassette subfamily B protein